MRARFPYPFLAFRTRGGANDRHTGELAGELGQYRTDAARRADDQQRVARVAAFLYAKTVEQQLPGGNGGERSAAAALSRERGLRATMRSSTN